MMNNSKFKMFAPCYYGFFISGAMALMVGAILPYIIEEADINYSVAGGLLSAFAVGNLLASFVNPVLVGKIGRRLTTVILVAMIPIMLVLITFLVPVPLMYLAMLLMGIGRGSVSIINNAIVNDNSGGKPAALNLLHMTFAIGAFLSPFLTSVFIENGLGWRMVVYCIAGCFAVACVGYATMELDYNFPQKKAKVQVDNSQKPFYKEPLFYCMGFLLFMYLGLENCVNGWFVTYFKSMGIMSAAYATNLVSVTWIMVMAGRLVTAKLSQKINKNKLILAYCIATAAFFVMLIATNELAIITIAIAGLGFFFAGIYPTSVSSVGNIIKGSNTGMSMFLALSALGGIVTPQLVGVIADYAGMTGGIVLLAVNSIGMFILAVIGLQLSPKNSQK